MKITTDLLLTRYSLKNKQSVTDLSHLLTPIRDIRLLSANDTHTESDYLYVTDCCDDNVLNAIPKHTAVVCFAKAQDIHACGDNIIFLKTQTDLASSFNALQTCFHEFTEWEHALDFAVFRGASFQEFLDLCEPMISSAILVYDPALRLLAHSSNQGNLKDPLFQKAVKNGYLDIETVQYFEQTNTFEQMYKEGSVSSDADAVRSHADYIRTVNIKNQLAVYAILLFTDILPHSYEKQLFDILCDAFEKLLEKQHSTFLRDRSVTDYFLMDLLDNPDTTKEQIRERIYFNDLDYEGNFMLLSVHSDVKKKSAEQFFLQYLRNNMIHCRIFPYRDSVVILYLLPQSYSLHYREQLIKILRPVFRDFSNNHIRVYASKPFFTIGEFADAYRQAENTRQIADLVPESLLKEPAFPMDDSAVEFTDSIFFFEDYWIQDLMFQNPMKNKTLFYCEPCLIELLEKDTKKSRQQLRILYEYLNCDRNYTDVAKKLDMHRNNVIYHIKNIEDTYHLNLDQAEVRLKLLLSFELLKTEALYRI